MEIYDHPTFRMACQQFDLAADHLNIPEADRARLKYPKRSMTVALPIKRDDGGIAAFTGHRVQHHLPPGPTKGGLREATGRGVGYLINRTMDVLGLEANKASAVVQGYGNVGSVAAFSLARYGVRVVAVSDVSGGIRNEKGLDLWKLEKHNAQHGTVVGFAEAEAITNDQLIETQCDILVPAALERQITEANADRIKSRIPAEAANGPTPPEADVILEKRGDFFVLPDILCNGGGVVVSYFEWVQDF